MLVTVTDNKPKKLSNDYRIKRADELLVGEWLFGTPYDYQLISKAFRSDSRAHYDLVLSGGGGGLVTQTVLTIDLVIACGNANPRMTRPRKWVGVGIETANQRLEMFCENVIIPYLLRLGRLTNNVKGYAKDKHFVRSLFTQGLPRHYWDRLTIHVEGIGWVVNGGVVYIEGALRRGDYAQARQYVDGLCHYFTTQKTLARLSPVGYYQREWSSGYFGINMATDRAVQQAPAQALQVAYASAGEVMGLGRV